MLRARRSLDRHRSLGQRGQALVFVGLMLVILLGAVGLAVDTAVGYFYSVSAERAAAAGALSGVPYMPDFVNAKARALAEVTRNGFTEGDNGGTTHVVPAPGQGPRQLQVTVTVMAPTFFMNALGVPQYNVVRTAIAGYRPPISLGQPGNQIGATVSRLGTTNSNDFFFVRTEGWNVSRSEGDAFTPNCGQNNSSDVHTISAANFGNESQDPLTPSNPQSLCSGQPNKDRGGYNYRITIPQGKSGIIQIYNAGMSAENGSGGPYNQCENHHNPAASSAPFLDQCNTNGPSYRYHDEDDVANIVVGSPDAYAAMEYTLFSVPDIFLRPNDKVMTQLKVSPIDASNFAAKAPKYTNQATGGTINQTYDGAGNPTNMKTYHSWIDIGGYDGCGDKDTGGVDLVQFKSPLGVTGCKGTAGAVTGANPNGSTYRLRVDTLDRLGGVGANNKVHKGYAVRVVDANGNTGPGTTCDTCQVAGWEDLAIYTPITGTQFDIPMFRLPADYQSSTIDVDIYDPGDASGNIDVAIIDPTGGYFSILNGGACRAAPATYTPAVAADPFGNPLPITNLGVARDGNGVNGPSAAPKGLVGSHGPTYAASEAGVRTTSGGTSQFNGDWVRISIPIPDCYNPDSNNDFWSLRYTSSGGTANDTITFGVTARGGPVRLISS